MHFKMHRGTQNYMKRKHIRAREFSIIITLKTWIHQKCIDYAEFRLLTSQLFPFPYYSIIFIIQKQASLVLHWEITTYFYIFTKKMYVCRGEGIAIQNSIPRADSSLPGSLHEHAISVLVAKASWRQPLRAHAYRLHQRGFHRNQGLFHILM